MKFKSLRIVNFMRFSGENEVHFNCDPQKNVTVVLGDNTVGKTTLAQAFRWCLYGRVSASTEKGSKATEIINTDVLNGMSANDHEKVEVELVFESENEEKEFSEYRVIRTAQFRRDYPSLKAIQQAETSKIYIKNKITGKQLVYDSSTSKDARKVEEIIGEFLPESLSTYFLFDGEKWNTSGAEQSQIKDSVYTLVGVSPIREMKRHLKECGPNGRNSVVSSLRKRMSGGGDDYQDLMKKQATYEEKISNHEKKIEKYTEDKSFEDRKANEVQRRLDENPNAQADQIEYKHILSDIAHLETSIRDTDSDIVNEFSKSYKFFATPLLEIIVKMLKDVDLEGVDIPGVSDKTIRFILKRRQCLCGHEILANSFEEKTLNELINVVPPAVIGQKVGSFEDKLANWKEESKEFYSIIKAKADKQYDDSNELIDKEEEKDRKEKKIDKKFNFEDERRKLNSYRQEASKYASKIVEEKIYIDKYKDEIAEIEQKLDSAREKNEANRQLTIAMHYAQRLYEESSSIFERKEREVLEQLNEIIKKNYETMFQEQEKYPKINKDYSVHMFFKSITNEAGISVSNHEASNLSEGEKIARNFAFIVSVLEYASHQQDDGFGNQTMPLVLDAPFSKLSSVNTKKVASMIPKTAEQVIVFMLDKDWKASDLNKYTDTDYIYRIEKDVNENSSKIIKSGGTA